MNPKWTALLVVALAVTVFAAWPRAQAQVPTSSNVAKWEYGRLVLGAGDPVFVTARRESRARPPSGSLAAANSNDAQSGNKVTFIWKDVYNTEMMTLDALGADGWEAYSSISDGRTTTIFVKRPL